MNQSERRAWGLLRGYRASLVEEAQKQGERVRRYRATGLDGQVAHAVSNLDWAREELQLFDTGPQGAQLVQWNEEESE